MKYLTVWTTGHRVAMFPLQMVYLLLILIGAVLGFLLRKQKKLLRPLSFVTFILLLTLIFFMGMEVDTTILSPSLVWQAVGICIASITGSVLCLAVFSFFRSHYDR